MKNFRTLSLPSETYIPKYPSLVIVYFQEFHLINSSIANVNSFMSIPFP